MARHTITHQGKTLTIDDTVETPGHEQHWQRRLAIFDGTDVVGVVRCSINGHAVDNIRKLALGTTEAAFADAALGLCLRTPKRHVGFEAAE